MSSSLSAIKAIEIAAKKMRNQQMKDTMGNNNINSIDRNNFRGSFLRTNTNLHQKIHMGAYNALKSLENTKRSVVQFDQNQFKKISLTKKPFARLGAVGRKQTQASRFKDSKVSCFDILINSLSLKETIQKSMKEPDGALTLFTTQQESDQSSGSETLKSQ